MAVSPNEASLASLSLSGQLCIWDLPSCHLKSKWLPEELVSNTNYFCMCIIFIYFNSLDHMRVT